MPNTIVTFQSMFMYSDYILQHTQAQSFWRLVHSKVATLKVIMFHYSGNGRTEFPGASGSINLFLWAHEQLFYSHVCTCQDVHENCPYPLRDVDDDYCLFITSIYLLCIISFHLHFSQIDLICDSSEIHCVVIMSCKTSVLYADVQFCEKAFVLISFSFLAKRNYFKWFVY